MSASRWFRLSLAMCAAALAVAIVAAATRQYWGIVGWLAVFFSAVGGLFYLSVRDHRTP